MTTDSATRRTVRAYHDARFRGDVPAAAAQIGEDFRFRSPFITSDSPTGHLDGLDGLLGIVTDVELISELYGDTEATLIYDVHTASPVGTQRTAVAPAVGPSRPRWCSPRETARSPYPQVVCTHSARRWCARC